MTDQLLFTLDGKVVSARPGETIWQVAQREGNAIPHLCWLPQPGYRADGNCRACMVEIEGERVLAASCIRKPSPDMVVKTATDRAVKARRMVMELLIADQPPHEDSPDRVLAVLALGRGPADRVLAFSRPTTSSSPTCRIRPWRSISMPASIAGCACGPAARFRSTTCRTA